MVWIDKPVLVHVGLHKTATSWLQDFYFPFTKNGFWVPPVDSSIRRPIKQIGHWFVGDEFGRLLDKSEFSSSKIRSALSNLDCPAGLMPVISNERLAGHPLSNGFDRVVIAQRIKEVFPQARILLTIREQNKIIMSNYMQYLRYGGWHEPEHFVHPLSDGRQPVLSLNFWNYSDLAGTYAKIFSKERVLVLPQEMLRSNVGDFVSRLAQFASVIPPVSINNLVEANPRRMHVSSYLLRRYSFLIMRSSANAFMPTVVPDRLGARIYRALRFIIDQVTPGFIEERVAKSLQKRVDAKIGDFYLVSNRRLANSVSFDLASLGYRL